MIKNTIKNTTKINENTNKIHITIDMFLHKEKEH